MAFGKRTCNGVLVMLVLLTGCSGSSTGPSTVSSQPARILVANQNDSVLQFFDFESGNLLKEVSTLRRPHEVIVDERTGLAYVSIAYRDGGLYDYTEASHEVQIVDLDRMEIVDTIDVTPHWGPHGMALNPQSGLLYVTCESNDGELIAVDLASKEVVGSVKVDAPQPHWVAVVPSGDKAYTANKEAPHVSVVDLREMKMVAKIPAPAGTEGILATPDGKYVFAGVQKGNDLLVIDPARDEPIDPIRFDQTPSSFALSPDGRKLYVLFFNVENEADGAVQEVDLEGMQPGAKVSMGRFPINMAVTPDGQRGIVSSLWSNSLAILDLSTMRVTRTIETKVGPHGVLLF